MFQSIDARLPARSRRALAIGAALIALFAGDIASAQDLTLSDALARAAARDPTGPASAARVTAAEAGVRQADVGPRPVIGVDLEDFAGTGPYSPVDRSQATLYYERTWERGGKREARTGVAQSELSLAQQRGRLRTLDLLAQVQAAWVEAQATQAAIMVAEDRLALAERVERDVGRRVGRALDPLFAGERARTAVAQARIASDQAIEAARIARANLASYWGGGDDFALDTAAFGRLDPGAPPGDTMPDLALLTAERDTAEARIRLEEARGVTDPTVRAGVRHFGQGNEVALVVGGSIPLGGRQANRANVERAQADRLAAEAEIAVARIDQKREADRLTASRASIAAEIARIDAEVLPSAERAVVMVRDGFNRGGTAFTYFEVAEAQRAVIDARTRRIDLLRRFHLDGVPVSYTHLTLPTNREV